MKGGDTKRVLVLSTFQDGNANVIRDFLFSFHAYSRHEYRYVFDCRILDGRTSFSGYDVILVFWSLYLLGPHLSPEAREAIRASPALKVLLLQDEYRDVRAFNGAMNELGIQVMLTCVDARDHETFYPRASIPTLVGTYSVLTGYVPDYLRDARPSPDAPRPVEIGYRAREVPFYLGDLGREKTTIARRFTRIAWEHGLRADISDREADRIYGRAWLAFLRSCRFALGSGSGASVVDFTGDIRRACDAYLAHHPRATYEEVRSRFFADVDGKVVIDTISPRVFESAAFGATLVLHDGPYAGILVPDVHYIAVRKDYSNVGEVLDRIRDRAFSRKLADAAHADLVASGRYSYRAFAARFDGILEAHARPARSGAASSRTAFYARNYWLRDQGLLPRGASFVSVPTPRSVWRRVGAAARLLDGPFARASRLDRSTLLGALKALVAVRLAFGSRELRAILGAALASREHRGATRLVRLARELSSLALLRRAREARPGDPDAFQVTLGADEVRGALRILSRPAVASVEGEAEAIRRELESADALLRTGGLLEIVWDHRAIGAGVRYRMAGRRLTFAVGEDGRATWTTLVSIGRSHPEKVGAALRAVLGPRAEHREGVAKSAEAR